MAKKKSKTQKYKKNLKKKLNKTATVVAKKEVLENKGTKATQIAEEKIVKTAAKSSKMEPVKKNKAKTENKTTKCSSKSLSNKESSNVKSTKLRQVVDKDHVKYNVALTEPDKYNAKKKDSNKNNVLKKGKPKKEKNVDKVSKIRSESNIKYRFTKIREGLSKRTKKIVLKFNEYKNKLDKIKEDRSIKTKKKALRKKIVLPKKAEVQDRKKFVEKDKGKKKNVWIRLVYELYTNVHIIFNALLVIFFLVLMIALFRIEVLKVGTILYIGVIVLFLILIALSYTKYMSGKIFSILLCVGMGFAIYQMQYTYDFVRNLASNVYEYKTYYVVTFNNSLNKSIYIINNKSVGLLKENCVNVERRLNTKLDDVNYIEYDDLNKMFDDFYSSQYRAIVVNENQYKYLKNNIQGNKDVKILYEFKANAKK